MLLAFSSFICILVLETDFFGIVRFVFQSLPQLFYHIVNKMSEDCENSEKHPKKTNAHCSFPRSNFTVLRLL